MDIETNNIADFMRRTAEKCGYVREKYVEGNLPTTFGNIVAIPYFGDMKHEFLLATMILPRIKEATGKYIIVCGQPGHAGLFPAADEYWAVKDEAAANAMLLNPKGFEAPDEKTKAFFYEKQLNRFIDTITPQELAKYYDRGLTKEFFDKFRFVTYSLHSQPGIRPDFGKVLASRPGFKVYIRPNKTAQSWRRGVVEWIDVKPHFWWMLTERLLKDGITPVIQHDHGTWPMSKETHNDCIHIPNGKLLDRFAIMRNCGAVLDVASGISRFALAARAPFVTLTERELYNQCKEYEIDDLCTGDLPHRYIFSFTTMIGGEDYVNLVDLILTKLKEFLPTVDPNKLPNTTESSTVAPYMLVREHKAKKFGSKFFKITKI